MADYMKIYISPKTLRKYTIFHFKYVFYHVCKNCKPERQDL
jgi:hypothetical protein